MSSLVVKEVPVEELVPDPLNVRTHDSANLQAIARSLDSFGQRKPLVVQRVKGDLIVLAGNGTLEAAKALGWETVSVAEVPREWDLDKARAYAIADNRTAELADWDKVALSSALLDLEAVGWEPITLGFETLNPPSDPPSAPDDFPEYGDETPTSHHCPKCGYEWNGSTK